MKHCQVFERSILGHSKNNWNPELSTYIKGYYNDCFIIDNVQTQFLLKRALRFINGLVKENGTLLWVGTNNEIAKIVQCAATLCGHPYVINQWTGGSLTNWKQMGWLSLPSAVFLLDGNINLKAIKEAKLLNIPVISLVDTNTKITGITFPIITNDESILNVYYYCDQITKYVLLCKTYY